MGAPVYPGMPPTDKVFDVEPWGRIRCGGPCKDDYDRIERYAQTPQRTVSLQHAAMGSFKAAELAITPKWMGKRVRRILVTGSLRSCAEQSALYHSDSQRFADPDTTGHTRALCIDVDQTQGLLPGFRRWRLRKINKALRFRDWHQARSDEPWHYSFGIEV